MPLSRMTISALLAAQAFLGACSSMPPAGEAATAASVKDDHNFEVVVYEVLANPEDDGLSKTKIYIDGNPAGEVPSGLKSIQKTWRGTDRKSVV